MRRKKNAFTLIELIAVLVILAIIALIVTPLVMNVVKKAKDSANKRSVDAYGKAVELGVATYLLDNGEYPTDLNGLTIEYSGNEVVCNIKTLNEDGSIYLSECSVKGSEVKDSSTEDGWYHYGKTTNKDVTYQAYKIGDTVTYNGINFYVIEASDENSDRVTMLKAEPLTVDELNVYGEGHVNMNVRENEGYFQVAYNNNGYGGMQYYSSNNCNENNSFDVTDGCITDYDKSEVKYVIDAWSNDKFEEGSLMEDSLGYKTRLMLFEDLTNNLGYVLDTEVTFELYTTSEQTPLWVYNSDYEYWTMSVSEDSNIIVYVVSNSGYLSTNPVKAHYSVVRPVITLKKSAIN